MTDLSQDFQLLREAARDAAALALSFWGRAIHTERKADGSAVTEADKAVDELFAARLRAVRPDYGWLSEESPEHTARLAASRVWIVDPIDGTRDFLQGGRDWTIAAALADAGKPVLSVIINPVREEIYEARSGMGMWLNGRRARTSQQDTLDGARVAIGHAGFTKGTWRKPWPEACPVYANSTLYRMALVASGGADASFALNPKWEWDIAAGALLVQEAGGVVTAASGEPLLFNSKDAKVEGYVAAAPELYPMLIEHLNAARGARQSKHEDLK